LRATRVVLDQYGVSLCRSVGVPTIHSAPSCFPNCSSAGSVWPLPSGDRTAVAPLSNVSVSPVNGKPTRLLFCVNAKPGMPSAFGITSMMYSVGPTMRTTRPALVLVLPRTIEPIGGVGDGAATKRSSWPLIGSIANGAGVRRPRAWLSPTMWK
jgi:hypothetical protein